MTRPLVEELRDALGDLVDVHHGDVALLPGDQVHYQQASYWKAIAALRRANEELGPVQKVTRLDVARQEAIALEVRLPVKQQLAAEYQTTRERFAAALPVIDRWEEFTPEDRKRKAAAFQGLARRLLTLAGQRLAPLPTTDACICRKCRRVLLPDPEGGYACCSLMWHHHRANNFHALPEGFWTTYRPGDRYTKQLDPALDGRGRLEMGEPA